MVIDLEREDGSGRGDRSQMWEDRSADEDRSQEAQDRSLRRRRRWIPAGVRWIFDAREMTVMAMDLCAGDGSPMAKKMDPGGFRWIWRRR